MRSVCSSVHEQVIQMTFLQTSPPGMFVHYTRQSNLLNLAACPLPHRLTCVHLSFSLHCYVVFSLVKSDAYLSPHLEIRQHLCWVKTSEAGQCREPTFVPTYHDHLNGSIIILNLGKASKWQQDHSTTSLNIQIKQVISKTTFLFD